MIKSFAVIALILLCGGIYSPVSAGEITVRIAGGVEKIDSFEEGNVVYFSLSELASILGEKISWGQVGQSAVFNSEGHTAEFFLDSPYFRLDDTVKNLTYPVLFRKGRLYLPAQTFIPFLNNMRPEQIAWDNEKRAIRLDSEWFNITDLNFSAKANGLLIELFVTEPVQYEIYITEGNWLNISIPKGRVNRRQVLARLDRRFLYDIAAEQLDETAQVSLRLRRDIDKYTHRYQANPGRIQISLIDTAAIMIAERNTPDLGPDNKIDRIVIDAGHGGKDYGAIGIKKTPEKKIVLDIAKRLAKLIRQDKIFEAVLTRDKDDYVSLEERARIANESGGDMFISIHANASLNRTARGFQVFFLAPALTDDARALAQLENAPFMTEMNAFRAHQDDDLTYIISDMIQTEFQAESADLSAMIDREFRASLNANTKARGIDQAGFYVLNGVYMPSVLVETAFLTNDKDEALLNDKDYRQKVAEAIYEGLKRFKVKYENK